MSIKIYKVQEDKVSAYFEQEELEKIVIDYIVSKTGFDLNKETDIDIYFERNERGLGSGFKTSARVKLTNDLLAKNEKSKNNY